jgi:hypothetical protein
MLFRARFEGRTKGAGGVSWNVVTLTEGNNPKEAELNLYTRYEHIRMQEFSPVSHEEAALIREGIRYAEELTKAGIPLNRFERG